MKTLTITALKSIARLLAVRGFSRMTRAKLTRSIKKVSGEVASLTLVQMREVAKLLGLKGLSRSRKSVVARHILAVIDPVKGYEMPTAARVTQPVLPERLELAPLDVPFQIIGGDPKPTATEDYIDRIRRPLADRTAEAPDYLTAFVSELAERYGNREPRYDLYEAHIHANNAGTLTPSGSRFLKAFRRGLVAHLQADTQRCERDRKYKTLELLEVAEALDERRVGSFRVSEVERMLAFVSVDRDDV